ncbi:MAG: ECF transporter S component [Anaeroplasmataceae bacterium]|nr:ECF transporter S component [Anaeroplasmataceae bacterium]MDE5868116.1 ECF transporter S component [Anaeroplasmataceae bacterium]
MKNKRSIQRMVGIASLAAITVVLQVIANYITIGPVNITLALIPLVIGAILYGPLAGAFLGVLMGGIILTAPTTAGFLSINAWATVFVVLVKTGVAGAACGWIFKLLRKKNLTLAIVLATIAAPIVNTGLFAIGCLLFFMSTLKALADGSNVLGYLFLSFIGYNFLIEFAVNSVLAPTVVYIVRVVSRNYNIGSNFNAGVVYDDEELVSSEEVVE